MSNAGSRFTPPPAIGEPYRADASGPPPFESGDPQEAARAQARKSSPGHPPSMSPQYARLLPPLQEGGGPASKPQLTPDQRFARTAFGVGIASLLVFQVVLGPLAVLLGARAVRRGERELGRRTMLLGAIGTLIGIAALVLQATGVIPPTEELLERLREGQ